MKEITTLLSLYLPIFLFILITIVVIGIKKVDDSFIKVSLFGFFSHNIPIKNIYLAKSILFIISFSFLNFYYISLDFTKFFPTEMKMTVHFNDLKGIQNLLNTLEVDEINGIPIDTANTIDRMKYFVDGDTVVQNYLDYENYYSDAILNQNSILETEGATTFIVKKISGIHNYRITEAVGKLTHTRYIKKKENEIETLLSVFNKTTSPNDKISIETLSQIFDKTIIAPRFNQSLIINGREETMLDHNLYGVTALYVLPYPSFSNTLYLYQHKNRLIPIGYAVYYTN